MPSVLKLSLVKLNLVKLIFTVLALTSTPAVANPQTNSQASPIELDCQTVGLQQSTANVINLATVWTNTRGSVRDITPTERSDFLNVVGRVYCQKSNGQHVSTATLSGAPKKDTPIIIFSGHSICDEATGQRLKPSACVFEYEKRLGVKKKYKFTQIATKLDCQNKNAEQDIAMARLEDFYVQNDSTVTYTDSVNHLRTINNKGEVIYKSDNPEESEATMFLVGSDTRYNNKIKISNNCGLFDNRKEKVADPDNQYIMAHDCISTPGYSGGPIFQKFYNYKLKKYQHKLICVHRGGTYFHEPKHPNYRKIIAGKTNGLCIAITTDTAALYKELDAL